LEIFDFQDANEPLRDSLTPVETALPVDTPVQSPSQKQEAPPQRAREREQGEVVHWRAPTIQR
jgi:hypothetical protein